ncbi:MAG: AsmA-like C-terminal domain-containing protein [Elusimicrobiota bacterium]|nr:AsmA-like C-terminal domain-containing protein [Elusimicrobiota bacterium]
MKTILKKVFDFAATLFGAILLFAAAVMILLNLTLKPYILRVLSGYLASDIKVALIYIAPTGDIICVSPRASSSSGEFLRADNAVIKCDVSSLRSKKLFFREIVFNNPDIKIARETKGFNISPLIKSVTAPRLPRKGGFRFSVGHICFNHGKASFFDEKSGRVFPFSDASLIIGLQGSGTGITLISGYGARPFTVRARYRRGWKITAKNTGLPVRDVLRIFGLKGDISGLFGSDIVYEGNFSDRNKLEGNLFLTDVRCGRIGGTGQIYFDGTRFFAEINDGKQRASAAGLIDNGAMILENIFVDYPSISAEAAGSLTLKGFRLKGQCTRFSINEDLFKGVLSGDVECDGEFGNIKFCNAVAMIKKGSGEFSRLSMLYNVLQTMDVFNYLIGRFPDYLGKFPVDSVSGEIVKMGSVISVKDVLIENEHSRTSVYGDVDIDKNNIDIVVGFQAQKFVNDVISKIPLVGYVLLGEKKSLLPVFVKVEGPISAPRVNAMAARTITGPLTGIVERMFKIPFRVFVESKKSEKK